MNTSNFSNPVISLLLGCFLRVISRGIFPQQACLPADSLPDNQAPALWGWPVMGQLCHDWVHLSSEEGRHLATGPKLCSSTSFFPIAGYLYLYLSDSLVYSSVGTKFKRGREM